jgi:hypothetical protein
MTPLSHRRRGTPVVVGQPRRCRISSVGPLEFIGDGRALAGEDKAIDPRDAAVDHLSGEVCHGEAQGPWQTGHPGPTPPGDALVGELVPALGEAIALGPRREATAAVGTGGELLLAVAGNDVTTPESRIATIVSSGSVQ